jgi:hypothetical protein
MRAIVIEKFGGPEGLGIHEVPTPKPRSGEVVIRVKAFRVNHAERTGNSWSSDGRRDRTASGRSDARAAPAWSSVSCVCAGQHLRLGTDATGAGHHRGRGDRRHVAGGRPAASGRSGAPSCWHARSASPTTARAPLRITTGYVRLGPPGSRGCRAGGVARDCGRPPRSCGSATRRIDPHRARGSTWVCAISTATTQAR